MARLDVGGLRVMSVGVRGDANSRTGAEPVGRRAADHVAELPSRPAPALTPASVPSAWMHGCRIDHGG
jgi:hypothetical protein